MSIFGPSKKIYKNGLIDAPEERREIVAVYENGDIFLPPARSSTPLSAMRRPMCAKS